MPPRSPTVAPIAISATWASRFWTTNPPRYDPHTEWRVRISISSDMPLRLARIVGTGPSQSVEKSDTRGCAFTFDIGEPTNTEPSPQDLANPWRSLGVEAPSPAYTWSVIPLVASGPQRSEVALLPIAQRDSGTLRAGRWRLRQDLWEVLPVDSVCLRSGRRGSFWAVGLAQP